MPYTIEDFKKDVAREYIDHLEPEERLRGLEPEELLGRISPEDIESYLKKLKESGGK